MVFDQRWGELLKFNGKAWEGTVEVGEIQGVRKSWSLLPNGLQVVSSEVCWTVILIREEYLNRIHQTGGRHGVRQKLLGCQNPPIFVFIKSIQFLWCTFGIEHTQSPIKRNELHVRLVHLSTSVGLVLTLQGFLHWQHSTTAALLLCYTTCQTKPGRLSQDPLCSCIGCREPSSPVQQVGHLYLLYVLMFNRTRVGGTFPGTSFLSPISMHAFGFWAWICMTQRVNSHSCDSKNLSVLVINKEVSRYFVKSHQIYT